MPYYKTSIGKTPFFTTNKAINIKYYNCELIKKRLESADIIAVVKKTNLGCSIISNSSYLKIIEDLGRYSFRKE